MVEITNRVKGVADKERWAVRGASFVAKLKATKVVWFPPKPVETGAGAASAATQASTKAATRTSRKAASTTTGAAKKSAGAAKKSTGAAKKSAGAAKKTTAGAKKVTNPVRAQKKT